MPGPFAEEEVRKLEVAHAAILGALRLLPEELLVRWLPTLTSAPAQEYLQHGVCRRLGVIARAIENIFNLCPPDRIQVLEPDARNDIEINLHAFVINVHGLLDNLAWVTIGGRCPTKDRSDVSLFTKLVREHLSDRARDFLDRGKEPIQSWHKRYARESRDALAHRIPLYVPPFALEPQGQRRYAELQRECDARLAAGDVDGAAAAMGEQERLERLYPGFSHSLPGESAGTSVLFHPQLVADSRTMLEVVRVVAPVNLPDLETRLRQLAQIDRH